MSAADHTDSISAVASQPVACIATPQERAWHRFRAAAQRYRSDPTPDNHRRARLLGEAMVEAMGKP